MTPRHEGDLPELETLHVSRWTTSTWNINGWGSDAKHWEIGERIAHTRSTITFIQELHTGDSTRLEDLTRRIRMHGYQAPVTIGNFSCGIISRKPLSNTYADPSGHFVIATTDVNGRNTTVASVHLPNGNRSLKTLFETMTAEILTRSPDCENVIIGGDWNCDLQNPEPYETGKAGQIVDWITNLVLTTCRSDTSVPTRGGRCIDFFVLNTTFARQSVKTEIHASPLSDHQAKTMTLLTGTTPQRNHWT
jgi:exonuclease III